MLGYSVSRRSRKTNFLSPKKLGLTLYNWIGNITAMVCIHDTIGGMILGLKRQESNIRVKAAMTRFSGKGLRKFSFISWMILTSSCFLLGMQEDMPKPLIQVKIIDPTSRLVLIQARLETLQKGDLSLFFKGPGINTEPRNISICDSKGKTFKYLQSPDGKISFRVDSSDPILISYELRPSDIYFDEKRLLLLGGHSLFLYDLEEWNPASMTFDLPKDFGILTTAIKNPDGSYYLSDVRDGHFLLGNFPAHFDIHEIHLKFSDIKLAVEKGSPYQSRQIAKFVAGFIKAMHSILGGFPETKMAVFFLQFPKELKKIGYRGSASRDTVYFFSGGLENESEEFKKRVLWKFGHELFHAFNPQSLKPMNPQDLYWFWEGFTDYMALKIMSYNRLYDNQAFLNACASVYGQYMKNPLRESLSLIQASREFFSDKNSEDLTYDKGFLVAFLMDLELFFYGDRLRSLDGFFKLLFRKYIEEKEACSGQKIMDDIDAINLLKQISDKYIKKAESETGKISFLKYGLEFMDALQKMILLRKSSQEVKEKILDFLTFAK